MLCQSFHFFSYLVRNSFLTGRVFVCSTAVIGTPKLRLIVDSRCFILGLTLGPKRRSIEANFFQNAGTIPVPCRCHRLSSRRCQMHWCLFCDVQKRVNLTMSMTLPITGKSHPRTTFTILLFCESLKSYRDDLRVSSRANLVITHKFIYNVH